MFRLFGRKFSRRKHSKKNHVHTVVLPIFIRSPTTPMSTSCKLPEYDANKLIIDVDAGVDDAFAILLALGEEALVGNVKVIAITCVHGNTNVSNVVVNVLKTLKTANRLDVPVYRGASESLVRTLPPSNYYGEDGFGDFVYPDYPKPEDFVKKEHAALALIRLVNENPGDVTLLCLGPLTNVAMAIRLDPGFLGKLQQLVVLGGSAEGVGNISPGIEFNFCSDPEASFIVLDATSTIRKKENVNPIVLVPWESVVKRNNIPMEWRKLVLGATSGQQMRMLNLAERDHLNERESWWHSADPIAAAITLKRSLVTRTTAPLYACVETGGRHSRGALFVDYNSSQKDAEPNVVIVQDIDVERYKCLLMESLSTDVIT